MKNFSHATSRGLLTSKLEYCKRPGAFGEAGEKINIPLSEVSTKTMEYMISQAEQQMKSLNVPEAGEDFQRKQLEDSAINWLRVNLTKEKYTHFFSSRPPPTMEDKINFYYEQFRLQNGVDPPYTKVPSVHDSRIPKNSNRMYVVQSPVRIPYDQRNYAFYFSKQILQGGYYLDGVKDGEQPPEGRRTHRYEVGEEITYLDGQEWTEGHYHDYRRLPKSIRDAYAKIIVFNLNNDPEIKNLLGDSTLVATWT